MIDGGRKVLDESVATIRTTYDTRKILFEPLDPGADLHALSLVRGVKSVRRDGAAWELALADDATPASVIPAVVGAVTPSRIEVRRPTLEDVFLQLTGRALRD
jgi:ABC-2 type transport system ATP-binding protein